MFGKLYTETEVDEARYFLPARLVGSTVQRRGNREYSRGSTNVNAHASRKRCLEPVRTTSENRCILIPTQKRTCDETMSSTGWPGFYAQLLECIQAANILNVCLTQRSSNINHFLRNPALASGSRAAADR
jgi:hypothetical protein